MKEQPFPPAKLLLGILSREEAPWQEALRLFSRRWKGEVEIASKPFPFTASDYYGKEMGEPLLRRFFLFQGGFPPERLPEVKLFTNRLEERLRLEEGSPGRVVNLDPGILSLSSLIMATAKNFAHRIPLRNGIYAHLEYTFTRSGPKELEWTYPDFWHEEYKSFFFQARRLLLVS